MIPKFRVWNKKTESFIDYGDLMLDLKNAKVYAGDVGIPEYTIDVTNQVVLMQSTGLKDQNGVEIFEGDILKIINLEYGEETFGQVVWGLNYQLCGNYPAFFVPEFESEMNSFAEIFDTGNYLVEIIGNIHQDPELLEVAE